MAVSLIVEFNGLPYLSANLSTWVEIGIDKWAGKMLQDAMANAPIQTSALRSSGFRVSPVYNDYNRAVAAMQAMRPEAKAVPPPAVQKRTVVIGFAADYAAPVEFGHHTKGGSFIAARPFLTPAIEAHRSRLAGEIKESVEKHAAGMTATAQARRLL